jgi:Indolepyruvate ferredoxin oxidoreductase, alpha and beta subunits
MQQLLLGDEAIAQGAIDAGISGIYAYPGTPSTEIMEYVQHNKDAQANNVHCKWSSNEKTALEAALGMSYAGKRSIVCMKHVGLNVAADPFMNSALTGVNGGLLIVSADDPSMHSSQNEQDSRYFGKFALLPVLEPSNQQEAYDMVHYGLNMSEELKIPVLFRITTRLAHSRTGIARQSLRKQNSLSLPSDLRQFILLPAIARVRYKNLLGLQAKFEEKSYTSGFNKFTECEDSKFGIISCGVASNYVHEALDSEGLKCSILKISQYPIPKNLIDEITSICKTIYVFEDGYPFLEEQLKGLIEHGVTIKGRLSGDIPRDGELNPTIVAKALGISLPKQVAIPDVVVNRPPQLCKGCSHIDTYLALNEAIAKHSSGRVFSDIGCYTLGALPPFNSINSCVDMGASITMAKGAADAGLVPAIAVIGDSTFTHSGMTGLLDAVVENSPITVIISDNETTGMTGGQPSMATNRLQKICLGLGVDPDHVKVIIPLKKNHEENVAIIAKEIDYKGVSVIVSMRECIQTAARRNRAK